MFRRFLPVALALCAPALSAQAAEVSVAVAANFTATMHKLAAQFEQHTGHKARLAFGSTGRLYAQIRHGAPFDVLLAADAETPARLEREGLGVAGSRSTYAIGRLVLWSAQPGLVDPQGQVLKTAAFDKIAVADPKLAPYGAAAMQAMTRLGVLNTLRPKFVLGESIGQAYQFVASGNAALGFVALSQVYAEGRLTQGSAWPVPAELHAPIRQDALLLRRGQGNPAATALLQYLQSEPARALMRAHGYGH